MFILRALNIHRVRRVNLFFEALVFGQLDSFHCLQDVPLLDHATRQSENVSDGWFTSKLIRTPKINYFIFPRCPPNSVLTLLIMFSFHFCVIFLFVWIRKQKKTSQKIWRFTGDVGFTGDSPHVLQQPVWISGKFHPEIHLPSICRWWSTVNINSLTFSWNFVNKWFRLGGLGWWKKKPVDIYKYMNGKGSQVKLRLAKQHLISSCKWLVHKLTTWFMTIYELQ